LDISSLLRDHVYTAVVLGGFVEGETTTVLAGYAAHQGYVAWWRVAAFSALVHFCIDQTWFVLGRWRGQQLMARFPKLARGVARLTPRLHRHRRWFAFSLRFLYGLRTAGPIAMGFARVPWFEFSFFSALGALAWSSLWCGVGYGFGQTITAVLGRIAHYEREALVVAAIVAVGVVVGLAWRHWRGR
jgi:membrane protein DedA with SNARE-associated domain